MLPSGLLNCRRLFNGLDSYVIVCCICLYSLFIFLGVGNLENDDTNACTNEKVQRQNFAEMDHFMVS